MDRLQEVFRLLSIPPLPGYTPAGITAVGVVMAPTGQLAHYPVYAQMLGTELSEPTEVRAAISLLQEWLRVQAQRAPGGRTR